MTSHFFPRGMPTAANPRSQRLRSQFQWFEGSGRFGETLVRDIALAAHSDINVLIVGETGTGKEVVAQWIHGERQLRSRLTTEQCPFVAVNCAAIPDNLVESFLFGHERGAFTSARQLQKGKFEIAKRGTLFLDEIQNLNLGTQSKLLRVVQNREFERLGGQQTALAQCQIITASNVPLELLIEKNHFRRDLYYRLNICPIYLPALRNRREDLPGLIEYFLKRIGAQLALPCCSLAPDALAALLEYPWPGNLRELEHSLMYASLRAKGNIRATDLPATLSGDIEDFVRNGKWNFA